MRVIAGKYKSRQLKTVESHLTRPTTDKHKENLFNMIGPYFDGGVVLDLFGGTGALGIEAISRGCDELYVVDKQYKAFSVIRDNIKLLGIEEIAHAYKMDYKKALEQFSNDHLSFDLVLLDPPYGLKINAGILEYLDDHHMFNDDCIIVVEDLNEEVISLNHHFHLSKSRSMGITTLNIYHYKGE